MTSYVADADLKSFLRIQGGIHDAEVNRAVSTAQAEVDRYCGWGSSGFLPDAAATPRLFKTTDRLLLHLNAGFWTATDLVVKTDDDDDGVFETTWSASEYELHPADGRWGGVDGWPYFQIRAVGTRSFPIYGNRRLRAQITAKWGWAACPPDVSTATLLRTAQIFQRRDNREGPQVPTTWTGGHDRDWMLLLDDYRHPDKLVRFA